jgi:rhodanese-related sulfurtransferase/DNA-binding transcriptional ArsR family regulator
MEYGSSEIFAEVARTARVLGNGSRLRLLQLLAQGERPVQELAGAAGLNVTTASGHLQALREVGLVASRRYGNQVIYRLAGADVAALVSALVRVAEAHHAVVGQALAHDGRDDAVEPMSREVLLEAVASGRVLVIDVRPADEYATGHLPGAVSMPLDELRRRLDDVPADQEVVAYCRGRVCELSHQAVDLLRSQGIEARPTEDGILEWRADGVELISSGADRP